MDYIAIRPARFGHRGSGPSSARVSLSEVSIHPQAQPGVVHWPSNKKTMSQQRIPKIKIFSRNFATNIFFIALFLAALLILLGVIIVVGTTIIEEPQKATFSTKLKDVDGGCWGEMCEFSSSEGGSVEIKAIDDLGGKGGILTFSATGKSFSSQITIGETTLEGPSSENGQTDFSQSISCKRGEDCKITIKVNIGKEGDVEISNLKLLYK